MTGTLDAAEFWHSDPGALAVVFSPQSAHDPVPRIVVDGVGDGAGHSIPLVVAHPVSVRLMLVTA